MLCIELGGIKDLNIGCHHVHDKFVVVCCRTEWIHFCSCLWASFAMSMMVVHVVREGRCTFHTSRECMHDVGQRLTPLAHVQTSNCCSNLLSWTARVVRRHLLCAKTQYCAHCPHRIVDVHAVFMMRLPLLVDCKH